MVGGRIRYGTWAVAVHVLMLVAARHAVAQQGQDGQIVGRVTDASGAAVPDVAVDATSPQLIGGAATTRTDAEGRYRFAVVPPGTYAVEVERHGFKPVARTNVVVPPGLAITVDVVLTAGDVAEAVEVSAPIPLVDVRSAASTTLIDRRLIDNLPLGRDVASYVNLTPGVARDVGLGGSASANPVTLDGASGNEPGWGTPTAPLTRWWLEEIQVVGPGAAARYGEFTGVTLNALTRSGTNRLTGLAEYWTVPGHWLGNNRGELPPSQAAQFRPLEVLERWEAHAQVGGPIVRNRLWYFGGFVRYRDDTRTAAFSALPRTPDEPFASVTDSRGIAKVTAAPSTSTRLDAFFSRTDLDGRALNAGPLVRPEALFNNDRRDDLWNARLTWAVSSRLLLDARHGGNHRDQVSGPPRERLDGPPPHRDLATLVQSVNAFGYNAFNSRVVTSELAVSSFVPASGAAAHDLRAGVQYERAQIDDVRRFPGNRAFLDRDGQPYQVRLWDGAAYRGRHHRTTLYAQDTWSLAAPVTLEAGLRLQFYGEDAPYPADYATRALAPRLGIAWDVGGRHDTVVRAHYGRYHDPIVSSYYDFLDPWSQAPDITAEVVGPDEFRELYRFQPATGYAIDPDIRASYVDEWLGGVERGLGSAITVKAQYLHRRFGDIVSFIDDATVWAPVQLLDPGPDGSAGTPDDAGPFTVFNNTNPGAAFKVMTNPDAAYRRYDGVQLLATRRTSGAWGAQVSYSWGRTRSNFNNGYSSNAANGDNSTNSIFTNPNRALNNDGATAFDVSHAVVGLGTLRVPGWGGAVVSGVYRWDSGQRWGRQVAFTSGLAQGFELVMVEPRVRQTPSIGTLDLRLEKTVPVRGVGTAGVYVDVFNVTNGGAAVTIQAQSGPRFGWPQRWSDPRTARLGLRLQF